MFSLETEASSHTVLQPPGCSHRAAYITGFGNVYIGRRKNPILCDESDLFALHIAEIQTGGPQTSYRAGLQSGQEPWAPWRWSGGKEEGGSGRDGALAKIWSPLEGGQGAGRRGEARAWRVM